MIRGHRPQRISGLLWTPIRFSSAFRISLLASVLFGASCFAEGAPRDVEVSAVLRIESGMHLSIIRSMATDSAGRFLVTASDDKTARVWSVQGGELLATLRPPIGIGNEGNLYAVSMTPDGEQIALGGWTDAENSVYLFSRRSGQLLRRFAGLPSVTSSLAFSPDGRFLAVGMAEQGIRVFSTVNGRLFGEDASLDGRVHGLAWRESMLVATCLDGKVRKWEVEDDYMVRIADREVRGGRLPYGVAIAPGSDRIALGFSDTVAVSVLDANSLEPVAHVNTSAVTNGNLGVVAWSDDGEVLWAVGRYQRPVQSRWQTILRRWTGAGEGITYGTAIADTAASALVPLPNGSMAFSSFDPSWGVVNQNGERILNVPAGHRSFRGGKVGPLALSLAPDAKALEIGTLRFSLDGRRFPESLASMRDAALVADGLVVDGWYETANPKVNEQALNLQPYEISRAVALASDTQSFALGSEWFLRRFDRSGRESWRIPASGAVRALNLSQDGRLLVAAYGDGVIRWHRYADGKELLALFVTADNKKWVMWTPSGYFDASPGGDELLGVHLNRGADREADFVPVSRLRESLRRPDVVDRVLEAMDEAEALRSADSAAGRSASRLMSVNDLVGLVSSSKK